MARYVDADCLLSYIEELQKSLGEQRDINLEDVHKYVESTILEPPEYMPEMERWIRTCISRDEAAPFFRVQFAVNLGVMRFLKEDREKGRPSLFRLVANSLDKEMDKLNSLHTNL